MFYKKFIDLCNSRGVSPTAVGAQIGVSKAAVSGWKNGSLPRDPQLKRLADYFGVPVEYFSEETPAEIKESPAPRAEVEDIIKIYDMLTPERQKQLRAAIADLLKDQLQE